jgi:hypothetical protein
MLGLNKPKLAIKDKEEKDRDIFNIDDVEEEDTEELKEQKRKLT